MTESGAGIEQENCGINEDELERERRGTGAPVESVVLCVFMSVGEWGEWRKVECERAERSRRMAQSSACWA